MFPHKTYTVKSRICSICTDGVVSLPLMRPIDSCRWRKLEGSDPSTYEMIQKIQTLQKRLITKTEEVVEKELLIQVGQVTACGVLKNKVIRSKSRVSALSKNVRQTDGQTFFF